MRSGQFGQNKKWRDEAQWEGAREVMCDREARKGLKWLGYMQRMGEDSVVKSIMFAISATIAACYSAQGTTCSLFRN